MMPTHRPPTHPGEMLLEEFLRPAKVTQRAFAERLGITPRQLSALLHRKLSVSPDLAVRLSRELDTTPDLWLNLQQGWDLWHERQSKRGPP